MLTERKIIIKVIDTDKSAVVNKEFSCNKCRKYTQCANVGKNDCSLVSYIRQRSIDSQYSINADKYYLTVNAPHELFERTRTIVRRAIRLRAHRIK